MRVIATIGLGGALLLGNVAAEEQSWPRFRGTGGLGVGAAQNVPVKLDQSTQAWSVPLPGRGSSSPVVWGDRLFVTSEDRRQGTVHLVCHRTKDGQELWRKTVEVGSYYTHKMNNAAAATPALAEDLVVFSWYDSGRKVAVLSAYSHEGEERWTYDVGSFKGAHGLNLPPEIHDDRIVLAHLHQRGGYVAALSTKTGKPVWRKNYPMPSPKTTYMTPLVRARYSKEGPRKEVVVSATSIGVRGLDFETGEELWSLPKVFKERCIVSPVDVLAGSGARDSLVIAGCKNNVFFAVRPPDVKGGSAKVVWRMPKNAPYVPTPVSDGKTLYVLSDSGTLSALDPKTGKIRWQKKLRANFYASPLLIGGKLYCKSRSGEMFVAKVGEKFELLATSDLNPGEEVTWADATPAVSDDRLFVRIGARLDCYRNEKK
jgi:outer membrane protein assembly factor BamB